MSIPKRSVRFPFFIITSEHQPLLKRSSDYHKSEFDEAGLGEGDAEAGTLADKVAVVKSESQCAFPALQLGGMPAGLDQHAEVMQHVSGRF